MTVERSFAGTMASAPKHPPAIAASAAEAAPADLRPAWERVAYTWLAREVDANQPVDPAALATEVSVNPRFTANLVQVLRVQRQRDPALGELRGRLVRDRITDAYLARELRGGTTLDAAELAREVGTTTRVARQWLHTLRAARSSDPRLAALRAEPVSHGQPTAEQLAALQAAYANGGRPEVAAAAQPAGSPLERIEQAWRTREVGHGQHLDPTQLAGEVGGGRAYAAQTLAALRGGELTNTQRITQLWEVAERDRGQHLDAPAVARMLGVREGRVRQVLGPLRTQQRQAADQQSIQAALPLAPSEGRLGWMDQAACKGLPTERFFPEGGEGRKAAEAKAICAGCQVQAPCRELAVRAADSLENDHGVFGGTVPTERGHLRPNRFPEPSAYRQHRKVAESARELASRVGLRQAAQQLGVSRDTLKNAWTHWNLLQPQPKPTNPPSRFLTDRSEAEQAFRLAEQLGSINAAAAELGTTWPSLRKAFQATSWACPRPTPRRSTSERAPSSSRGAAASGPPRRSLTRASSSSTPARCHELAATVARRRCGCAVPRRSRPSAWGGGRHEPGKPLPAPQRPTPRRATPRRTRTTVGRRAGQPSATAAGRACPTAGPNPQRAGGAVRPAPPSLPRRTLSILGDRRPRRPIVGACPYSDFRRGVVWLRATGTARLDGDGWSGAASAGTGG
jgi:hypothetical protein